MRVGSLFAGIGGFDLAARWMGWETAWFSEIDPYASAVLAKHWPDVPNLGDITKIEWQGIPKVDLLCGGFPCQDISNAGKRAGIDGSRSGLWGEFARAIHELRPRYVVVENVAALLVRGLGRVLGDLSTLGYDAEWQILSAAAVGAPHQRERVWVVAYPECQPPQPHRGSGQLAGAPEPHQGTGGEWEWLRNAPHGSGETLADADRAGRIKRRGPIPVRAQQPAAKCGGEAGTFGEPTRPDWWAVEPDVGRVAHGIPRRVDRLRCLGNAIVPQCALVIFKAIAARENAMRLSA